MGAIAGPLATFALLQVMDIRGIFLVSLIPGAIVVLILKFAVRENASAILSNIRLILKGNNRPFAFLLLISGDIRNI
jgi:hypothetical protein